MSVPRPSAMMYSSLPKELRNLEASSDLSSSFVCFHRNSSELPFVQVTNGSGIDQEPKLRHVCFQILVWSAGKRSTITSHGDFAHGRARLLGSSSGSVNRKLRYQCEDSSLLRYALVQRAPAVNCGLKQLYKTCFTHALVAQDKFKAWLNPNNRV